MTEDQSLTAEGAKIIFLEEHIGVISRQFAGELATLKVNNLIEVNNLQNRLTEVEGSIQGRDAEIEQLKQQLSEIPKPNRKSTTIIKGEVE